MTGIFMRVGARRVWTANKPKLAEARQGMFCDQGGDQGEHTVRPYDGGWYVKGIGFRDWNGLKG